MFNQERPTASALWPPELPRVMTAGESIVTVHGKITYDDIFGESHWLTFCGQDIAMHFEALAKTPSNVWITIILTHRSNIPAHRRQSESSPLPVIKSGFFCYPLNIRS